MERLRQLVGVGLGAGVLALASCAGLTRQPAAARPTPVSARELGKLLFFEPALSANGKRSCASCHRPDKAFTDQRVTPRALRFTDRLTRNSPTLLGAAGQARYFHDGRARSLAEVIGQVLANPQELGSSYAEATQRLGESAEYRQLFRQALGEPVSAASLNAALAAYIGSLSSRHAPYDLARRGQAALSGEARAGAQLFAGRAGLGCGRCHGGADFRDGRRHEVQPGEWVKTPTLRNVAVTAPYGAAGQLNELADAFDDAFHQRQRPAAPLTAPQRTQLLAFLAALTDTTSAEHRPPATLPALPGFPERRIGGLY